MEVDRAIQAVIEALREQVARLGGKLEQAQRENQRLRDRVEELERAAARQAAPFRRQPHQKKNPSQHKKPGRPKGHPGAPGCRAVPGQIDQVVTVPLERCPKCGGAVGQVEALEQVIEEVVPTRPHVTKLTTHSGVCACCGDVRSTHPLQTSLGQGAAKVGLGPRALGLAALLNKHLGLMMRKTCGVLEALCGLRLTAGGLSQALDRVADKVAGDYEKLIDQLRDSDAVFGDETSWWVGGPGQWLWVFTDVDTTLYRVDESRESDVVVQVLGQDFQGMLPGDASGGVSDCLSSYDPPTCRKHKCIAHHQRAIAAARDRPGTTDMTYLDEWKVLFKAVTLLPKLRSVLGEAQFTAKRDHLQKQVDALLDQPVSQPGDVAVGNRLLKQRAHLLGCLHEPAAEPTNNRAERALRPAVIARKLSCGNNTDLD